MTLIDNNGQEISVSRIVKFFVVRVLDEPRPERVAYIVWWHYSGGETGWGGKGKELGIGSKR